MNTFEKAKVGDRVWSLEHGWGKVEDVDQAGLLGVRFKVGTRPSYYSYVAETGKRTMGDSRSFRTLYWDEIQIIPPPKPKHFVKKVVEGWIKYDFGLLRSLGGFRVHNCSNIFDTKEQCEGNTGSFDTPACKIRLEWEEEE